MDGTSGLSASTRAAYEGLSTTTETSGKSARELGESDFYELMVAQLTHQDPLEPMSNTEYVAQLAQFTSLAQMTSVNENLIYLQLYEASINNTLAVSLVGKDVKVGSDELELNSGECNKIWYSLPSDASELEIRIKDSDGSLVRTVDLGSMEEGEYFYEWDGTDSNGNTVADGVYQFEIVASSDDGMSIEASSGVRARVTGISFEDGVTYLLLNGQKVPLSDITQVYEGEDSNDE